MTQENFTQKTTGRQIKQFITMLSNRMAHKPDYKECFAQTTDCEGGSVFIEVGPDVNSFQLLHCLMACNIWLVMTELRLRHNSIWVEIGNCEANAYDELYKLLNN